MKKTLAMKSVDEYSWVNIAADFLDGIRLLLHSILVAQLISSSALAAVSIMTPVYYFAKTISVMIGNPTAYMVQSYLGNFRRKEAGDALFVGMATAAIAGVVIIVSLVLGEDAYFKFFGASQQTIAYARAYFKYLKYAYILFPMLNVFSSYVGDSSNAGTVIFSKAVSFFCIIILSIVFTGYYGIAGIGLAQLVSSVLQILLYVTHFFSKHNSVRPRYRGIRHGTRGVAKRAVASGALYLTSMVGSLAVNRIITTSFPELSDGYLSVYTMVSNVCILTMFFSSVPNTVSSHVILYNEEENAVVMKKLMKHSLFISIGIAAAFTVIVFVVIGLFTQDIYRSTNQELVSMARQAILLSASVFVFRAAFDNFCNFYIAQGRSMVSAVCNIIKEIGIYIPLLILFSNVMGMNGIWLAGCLYEIVACVVVGFGVWLYVKLNRKLVFPWLFDSEKVKPVVYDVQITKENVIRLRDSISGMLSLENVPEETLRKVELTTEEYGELLRKSNDKEVLSEWDVYRYDTYIEMLVRDDGKLIDLSTDSARDGLSAYLLECMMPVYGDLSYAKSISSNRHRFRIKIG